MTTWTQLRPAQRPLDDVAARSRYDALFEIGIIAGAVLLYFSVRGVTEGSETAAVSHGLELLRLEQRLGLDVEAQLQGWALNHSALVTFMNWVYIWGHWPAIAAILLWLHRSDHAAYQMLRNAMFLSGAIGLVIFLLHPVAPPRLLGDAALHAGLLSEIPVDTVAEKSNAYRVLQPPSLVNKYAALPSFHVGWNLLVGLALYQTTRQPVVRLVALAGPPLMALSVVVTANHYLLDVVAGSAIAVVAWEVVRRATQKSTRPRAGALPAY